MKQDKKEEPLYTISIAYEKETKELAIEQKNDLSEKIKEINENLNSKKDIEEFLDEGIQKYELTEKQFNKAKQIGRTKLFVIIKIIGFLFFTTHLISIYIINGIINAIEEELIASAKSYLKKMDRDKTDDFYQNFNRLNNRFPDYSVFFISSVFSECLNECFGYIILSILILIIIFLSLFFGFKEYEFNLERNNYQNYTLNEFISLYFIYLFLCIFEGIIALIPLKIIKDGFIFYENYIQKNNENVNKDKSVIYNGEKVNNIINDTIINIKHNNDKNNDNDSNSKEKTNTKINENNSEINLNNENNEEKKIGLFGNSGEKKYKIEGFFLFYLLSVIISVLIKIILDQRFIGEYKYNNRKQVNYYFIISYCGFSVSSILLYIIYKCFMIKDKDKEKNQKNKKAMKVMGYIIYNETKENEDICCNSCECCADCGICCEYLNKSLCCYLCSCKCCFKGISNCYDCCNLDKACNKNVDRIRKIKDINKSESICIIYRVTGICNWLGRIFTELKVYCFMIILYYILIINMGFEERIWINLDNHNEIYNNIYIINGITLISILVFYYINKIIGKCYQKLMSYGIKKGSEHMQKLCPGELNTIISGISIYSTLITILSIIFSGMVYYKKMGKMENYLLSINVGSIEYIKICILEIISFFFEINFKSAEFFSISTIFSFYFLIWNIILFFLDIGNVNNDSIILFQFIFGIVAFCLYIILPTVFISICNKIKDKRERDEKIKKAIGEYVKTIDKYDDNLFDSNNNNNE